MNRRFLDGGFQDSRNWIEGAESYVANLTDDGRSWLLSMPFTHSGHSIFFYEMYQVLNLIEVIQLKERSRILEIGSGPGWVTEILIKLGHDVDSVEPSGDMIQIAQDRLSEVKRLYKTGKAFPSYYSGAGIQVTLREPQYSLGRDLRSKFQNDWFRVSSPKARPIG